MKKLLTIFALLTAFTCSAQFDLPFKEQTLTYTMADGDGTVTTDNFISYSGLSFQINAASLDDSDATVQVQKSNDGVIFTDITGSVITLPTATTTNYLEVVGAKNEVYRLDITVNSVTAGTLTIHLTGSR